MSLDTHSLDARMCSYNYTIITEVLNNINNKKKKCSTVRFIRIGIGIGLIRDSILRD